MISTAIKTKTVFVFKTNVENEMNVGQLKQALNFCINGDKWNFDLEDCDKIFRVETSESRITEIENIFWSNGFEISELDD